MPVSRQKPRNPGEGRGTFPKKVLRILIACLLVLVCLLALAQCGLEDVPYLTPPKSLTSGSFFRVQKPAANDTQFSGTDWEYQGIELYYKLYVPGVGVPPSSDTYYTQLSELLANGFFRIASSDEQSGSVDKPLIDIAGLWLGNINFRIDPGNLNIVEEGTDTEVVTEIRRGVLYDGGEGGYPAYRPFLWIDNKATNQRGFDASHADVSTELFDYMNDPINTGSPLTIVLYALSYGKTGGILLDLHSDAEYLGSQDVNFGW
jgi:hypothetical protein